MTRPRSRPNATPLPVQEAQLLRRYPDSRVVRTPQRLTWLGQLTPAPYCDTYDVLIDHQPWESPLVYVSRPHLQLVGDDGLPHVYSWNTLCLYLTDREWNPSLLIADTLVPWASEWLYFYEGWIATQGDWSGEGVHPSPDTGTRGIRRTWERTRQEKLERLRSGLIAMYGPGADVERLSRGPWNLGGGPPPGAG
ncbi:MAG: hypothetical protein WEB09_05805, partial [Nitriliruptor sp.]